MNTRTPFLIMVAAVLVTVPAAVLWRQLQHPDIPAPPVFPAPTAGLPVPVVPSPRRPHAGPAARGTPPADGAPVTPLPTAADAIPGEYSLRFFNARDREAFETLAARHGIRITDRIAALHAVRITAPDPAALRALLAVAPRALDFSPNSRVRITPPVAEGPAAVAPATPYTAFGDGALDWLGVPAPDAEWGRGVRVAVLDSGISSGFQGTIHARFDLTGEGLGDSSHGSAVASLISGQNGMVPGAALLDFKVLSDHGGGDVFTLAHAIIQAADLGVDIINISAGTRSDSPVLAAAVAYARERNVLIVAAAGNDGLAGVSYPAAYEGVVAVGGVDGAGLHLHFSNTGPAVDLSAPGIGVAVPGPDTGERVFFSGTSAAAPFVTATAALLKSQDPQLKPVELANLLKQYSNDAGQPGVDEAIGAGILDVGRLLDRDTTGIVDMAAMRPYVYPADGQGPVRVEVAGQNHGTVPLPLVEMTVVFNGQSTTLSFAHVGVGDTVVHRLQKDAAAVARDGLDVTVTLRTVGRVDSRPANNAVRFVLLPSDL